MSKKAQNKGECDPFARSRESFEQMVSWLNGPQAPSTEAEMETRLFGRGMEVLRQLLEARLRVLSERERADLLRNKPGCGLRSDLSMAASRCLDARNVAARKV